MIPDDDIRVRSTVVEELSDSCGGALGAIGLGGGKVAESDMYCGENFPRVPQYGSENLSCELVLGLAE